jgi:hypothetical protein
MLPHPADASHHRWQWLLHDEGQMLRSWNKLTESDVGSRLGDGAERTVHVFIAPELQDDPPGTLLREDDETEQSYAIRAATLRTLLGGPYQPVAAPTDAGGPSPSARSND